MSTIEQPNQDAQEERQLLDWMGRNYGQEVQEECLRLLGEREARGEPRKLTAELLEHALYRLNKQDIDAAVSLGSQCFSSD